MGNNQVRSLDDFPEGFTYVRAVNQAPFKNCRIFQKNSTKQLIAVMLLEELPKDVLKFRGVSEYLVDFIDWCKEDINLCGVQASVSLFYEYCPTNLEAEIMKKRKSNEQFSESQIWYVLNAIVNLESDLSVKSLAHADLRPCNVLIAQNDLIKFAPAGYFPYEVNSYKKQIFLNEQTYLAPENRDPNLSNVEWQINDVYAAGLTILDMMTLQLSNNDQKSREAIQLRLKKSKYQYSAALCDFVEKMLKEKTDRITFKQIKQMLLPFQKQINALQQFELPSSENPQELSRSLRLNNEKDPSPQERLSVPPSVNQQIVNISSVNQQQFQQSPPAQEVQQSMKVETIQRPQIVVAQQNSSPQTHSQLSFKHQLVKTYTHPEMKQQLLTSPQPQLIPVTSQSFMDGLGVPKPMSFAQPQRSTTPTISQAHRVQQPQPTIIPLQVNSQYTFMPQTSNRLPQPQSPNYISQQQSYLQQFMKPIQSTRDVSPILGKNIQSSITNNSIYLTPKIGMESRKPSSHNHTTPFQRLTPNTQSFSTTPVMKGQSIYSHWGTRLPNEEPNPIPVGDDYLLHNTLRKAEQAISLYHSLRHKV